MLQVLTIFSSCSFRSQALRETKELKWLDADDDDDNDNDQKKDKKKTISNKDVVCPFCKKSGHKTKIAKACLMHHEWLDINNASPKTVDGTNNLALIPPTITTTTTNHPVNGGSTGMGGISTSTTSTCLPLEPSFQNNGVTISSSLSNTGTNANANASTNTDTNAAGQQHISV